MDPISDLIGDAIPTRPSSTRPAGSSSEGTLAPANLCPCPDCGGVGYFKLDLPHTHPDFGKIVRCQNEVHQPQFVARLATRSGLVPEDLETRLGDFREVHRFEKNGAGEKDLVSNREMLEAARAFVKDPYGFLYLWGGPGNAKSDVLIAVVNEINLAAGQAVAVYIKFSRLVEYMREAYVNKERQKKDPYADMSYYQRFEQVKNVKVLAIDEFDFDGEKLRETPFVQEFRFDFLDDRYHLAVHGRTATIFASNSPPESLPEPIYDRVRDGRFKIVHNTAPSARPAMRRR